MPTFMFQSLSEEHQDYLDQELWLKEKFLVNFAYFIIWAKDSLGYFKFYPKIYRGFCPFKIHSHKQILHTKFFDLDGNQCPWQELYASCIFILLSSYSLPDHFRVQIGFFCWLGHLKMSFCYSTSHMRARG